MQILINYIYKKFYLYLIVIILIIIGSMNFVYAFSPLKDVGDVQMQADKMADEAGFATGYTGESIGNIMASVIKGFLALIGVIFIILIIYAGYKWMTAEGNEDKVKEAKDTIQKAIIGLIIIIAAYSITYFVFKYLPWGTGGSSHEL